MCIELLFDLPTNSFHTNLNWIYQINIGINFWINDPATKSSGKLRSHRRLIANGHTGMACSKKLTALYMYWLYMCNCAYCVVWNWTQTEMHLQRITNEHTGMACSIKRFIARYMHTQICYVCAHRCTHAAHCAPPHTIGMLKKLHWKTHTMCTVVQSCDL